MGGSDGMDYTPKTVMTAGGGGVKGCQDGLGHFFPTLPGGIRACQDGLRHFFPRLPV